MLRIVFTTRQMKTKEMIELIAANIGSREKMGTLVQRKITIEIKLDMGLGKEYFWAIPRQARR